MNPDPGLKDKPLLTSQRIVQICLFLFAFIAIFGGSVQMLLGEPDTTPRLDNIHRFLAGVYLGTGLICAWCGWTIRKQDMLVYLIAFAGLLAACGRLVSMNVVGLPEPAGLWLFYLGSELVVPVVMIIAQRMTEARGRVTGA